MDPHTLFTEAQRALADSDWSRAGELLEQLSKIDKKNARHHVGMGFCATRLGNFDAAREHLARAIKLSPMNPDAYVQIGHIENADFNAGKAVEHFRRALMVKPNYPPAVSGLVNVLRKQGEYDEATAVLEKAYAKAKAPDAQLAEALATIAIKQGRQAEAIQRLNETLSGELSTPERSVLLYRLAELLNDAGQYIEAFDAVAEGARLRRMAWDMPGYEAQLTEYFRVWTRERFESIEPSGNASQQPVFVLGVPRSGTSLVEQIIASHPEAAGVGELPAIVRIAADLQLHLGGSPSIFMTRPEFLKGQLLADAANTYLEALHGLAGKLGVDPDQKRIVDKLPHAYAHLPLIRLMFPKARIVHVTRDPRDTAVSCFFQGFDGPLGYTFDLKKLARMIAHERTIVRHATEVLGIEVLSLRYEKLVAEPEGQIRGLLEHVGLPFHENCLAFHQTRRMVVTASTDQVRRPMYSGSVSRWRRFEGRLGPLLEGFREVGFDPDRDA